MYSLFFRCFFFPNKTASGSTPQIVTDVCLGCICEAVSGCDRTKQCSDGVCGLFGITWAYWSDSGKPTLKGVDAAADNGEFLSLYSFIISINISQYGCIRNILAFESCVNDPYCAAESIQGYMNKFGQVSESTKTQIAH